MQSGSGGGGGGSSGGGFMDMLMSPINTTTSMFATQKASDEMKKYLGYAARMQIEERKRQMEMIKPWYGAGKRSINTLTELLMGNRQRDAQGNITGVGPQFEDYEKSPYYGFLQEEGTKALERGAAARGGVLGGAQQKALSKFGQNLASTDYGNWLNRWYQSLTPYMQLAGMGQNAAAQQGQASLNIQNTLTGLTGQQGQNEAARYLGYGQNLLSGQNQFGQGLGSALSNIPYVGQMIGGYKGYDKEPYGGF